MRLVSAVVMPLLVLGCQQSPVKELDVLEEIAFQPGPVNKYGLRLNLRLKNHADGFKDIKVELENTSSKTLHVKPAMYEPLSAGERREAREKYRAEFDLGVTFFIEGPAPYRLSMLGSTVAARARPIVVLKPGGRQSLMVKAGIRQIPTPIFRSVPMPRSGAHIVRARYFVQLKNELIILESNPAVWYEGPDKHKARPCAVRVTTSFPENDEVEVNAGRQHGLLLGDVYVVVPFTKEPSPKSYQLTITKLRQYSAIAEVCGDGQFAERVPSLGDIGEYRSDDE